MPTTSVEEFLSDYLTEKTKAEQAQVSKEQTQQVKRHSYRSLSLSMSLDDVDSSLTRSASISASSMTSIDFNTALNNTITRDINRFNQSELVEDYFVRSMRLSIYL